MASELWVKMILHRLRNRYYVYHLRRKNLPGPIRDYLQAFTSLDLERSIQETEFVVFDTETTGFNVRKGDRIVSISAVRLREGRIDLSDSFHALVNPDRDIPSKAAIVHGILPRMVIGKPMLAEVIPGFITFIGSSVLVAHHSWLDMAFLNFEMIRLYGFPIQNVVLDTAVLDRALMERKIPSSMRGAIRSDSSLTAVAERYHVSIEDRHCSFGDALATAEIFQNMIKQVQGRGLGCLRDLLRIAFPSPGASFI